MGSPSLEELFESMGRHRISVEGLEGDIAFIGRRVEVSRLLTGVPSLPGGVSVLYGPRGCGKSTLLKVLMRAMMDLGLDTGILAVFPEKSGLWAREILVSGGIAAVVREAGRRFGFNLDHYGRVIGSIGVFDLIDVVSGYIAKRSSSSGRDIVIILDGIGISSVNKVSQVARWLGSLYRVIERDHRIYRERGGGNISLVIVVGNALVREVWKRLSGSPDLNIAWSLMWNLSRDSSDELADQLGLDLDRDLLWRLAGGNPREMLRIKIYGLERWIRWIVIRNLWGAIISSKRRYDYDDKKTLAEMKRVMDNLDDIWNNWAVFYLVKRDIIMPLHIAGSRISRLSSEPWMGRKYSFQVPAYYYALRAVIGRRGVGISVDDVIKEAEKG